jgi:hypothetical protein
MNRGHRLQIPWVSPEWHGIKHFLNSVSDVGWVETRKRPTDPLLYRW